MVFFTCSHCGESIKKPSVAKHYQTKCKNQIPFLTCVDCLKDFKGNDYEGHTKCFTEEEKYSAKGFVPKSSSNKGERKQKAWSECVQGLLQFGELKDDERNFLQSIVKFDNIPRKKVKFINFLNTTARSYANNMKLIDRVWEKLENYFKEVNSAGNQQKMEVNETEEKTTPNKDKKRKHNEISNSNNNNNNNNNSNNNADENEKVPESISEKGELKKKKKKKHSGAEEEIKESVPEVSAEDKKSDKKSKKSEIKNLNETGEQQSKKSKKCKKTKIEGNVNGMENMEVDNKENVKDVKESLENGNLTEKNGEQDNITGDNVSFNWNDVISDVLSKNAKDNKISLKKLQKKVLKKYCKTFQCETNEKIIKKFMKKLNKVNNLTVNGEHVCVSK